eukprot:289684-Chlamydomonas_euryale.AAC.2
MSRLIFAPSGARPSGKICRGDGWSSSRWVGWSFGRLVRWLVGSVAWLVYAVRPPTVLVMNFGACAPTPTHRTRPKGFRL